MKANFRQRKLSETIDLPPRKRKALQAIQLTALFLLDISEDYFTSTFLPFIIYRPLAAFVN
jgi:hypothetical protein